MVLVGTVDVVVVVGSVDVEVDVGVAPPGDDGFAIPVEGVVPLESDGGNATPPVPVAPFRASAQPASHPSIH
jgi:hypothetical protein